MIAFLMWIWFMQRSYNMGERRLATGVRQQATGDSHQYTGVGQQKNPLLGGTLPFIHIYLLS
jgi:hypothetical protein